MSQRARMQTPTRTSQSRREAGFRLALAVSPLEPCSSPSTPSPKGRSFAWSRPEKPIRPFGAVHPRPALMAGPDGQRAQRRLCCLDPTASLYRRPSAGCFHRAHLSRIFPAHPRSLATVLVPRPAARHGSASACQSPCGFRLSENLLQRTQKHFPNLPKKRRLALGAGHLASLRARVSRGHSGQIQTGERRWNSIPTT
jgi:hypothetical protein